MTLKNNEETLENIALAFGAPLTLEEFRAEVGMILENSEKYHDKFTIPEEQVFKVIVAGGRDYNEYFQLRDSIDKELAEIDTPITIVAGGARGADTLAKLYAREKGYKYEEHLANWEEYGKSAGYKRNVDMAKSVKENGSGILVAFWDGKSKGTSNMIDIANRAGIPTFLKMY